MQGHVIRCAWLVATLALVAGVAVAEDVITRGVDKWDTSDGSSFTSFADDPIPADFFCPGSRPFTGKVVMNGKPLVTDPAGVLGKTDTIVHRLDDAYIDEDGAATTRLQLMALSLVGSEPIDVGCETEFEVSSSLAGEQPITEMHIVREAEWGGTYAAPLSLGVKVVFTPIGGGEPLEVRREVHLGAAAGSYWTTTDRVGTNGRGEPVKVDTDGDGVADSALPGPSNFVAGMGSVMPAGYESQQLPDTSPSPAPQRWCPGECCHCKPEDAIPPPQWNEPDDGCDDDHMHCVDCWVPCIIVAEPVPHQL